MMKHLAALLLGLSACAGRSETTKNETPVLRAYDVPNAHSSEVGSAIRQLLAPTSTKQAQLGAVSFAPSGKMMVAAPEGIQRGIKDLVDELAHARREPAPIVTIETWVVVGRPSAGPPAEKSLGEIGPALDEISKGSGPMEFELLEKLRITEASGQTAEVRGAGASLKATSTVIDGKIDANLEFRPFGPNEYRTHAEIAGGRLLVLGQSGYAPKRPGDPFFESRDHSERMTIFYVVHAQASAN